MSCWRAPFILQRLVSHVASREWVSCECCHHRAMTAQAPKIIRWGAKASSDMLRRAALGPVRSLAGRNLSEGESLLLYTRYWRGTGASATRPSYACLQNLKR